MAHGVSSCLLLHGALRFCTLAHDGGVPSVVLMGFGTSLSVFRRGRGATEKWRRIRTGIGAGQVALPVVPRFTWICAVIACWLGNTPAVVLIHQRNDDDFAQTMNDDDADS